jgi:hypothetical protein
MKARRFRIIEKWKVKGEKVSDHISHTPHDGDQFV